jgi:hypothetical protein
VPQSPDSHFAERNFSEIWDDISSGLNFGDFCECDELQDNGAGSVAEEHRERAMLVRARPRDDSATVNAVATRI